MRLWHDLLYSFHICDPPQTWCYGRQSKHLVVGHVHKMSLLRGPSTSQASLPENLSHAKPDGANYQVFRYELTQSASVWKSLDLELMLLLLKSHCLKAWVEKILKVTVRYLVYNWWDNEALSNHPSSKPNVRIDGCRRVRLSRCHALFWMWWCWVWKEDLRGGSRTSRNSRGTKEERRWCIHLKIKRV